MPISPDAFRALALALPEVEEGSHHDHPDFRRGGRVMASLHPDGVTAMVKVAPGDQAALLDAGDTFRPASGAWGRAGCTLVALDRVGRAQARDALTSAWEYAAALGAPKIAKKRVAKKRAAKKKAAKK